MDSPIVVRSAAPSIKNKLTAKPSKNTVEQTRDGKIIVRLKSGDEPIKIKIIKKPWVIGVQQYPVALLSYMKSL
ncbi:MAG: hypothetical protein DRH93_18205 [Deltaproteobacteria bacterium]|nr:MAG: hypothetical protein DRH93_18205 [Deltaproteobacteria bacterium]